MIASVKKGGRKFWSLVQRSQANAGPYPTAAAVVAPAPGADQQYDTWCGKHGYDRDDPTRYADYLRVTNTIDWLK
jgi:hypothetical protein